MISITLTTTKFQNLEKQSTGYYFDVEIKQPLFSLAWILRLQAFCQLYLFY